MLDPIVKVENLNFSYKKNSEIILKNISFELIKGEMLGIIGPNGGGKTTLLKILANRLIPTSGNITINRKNLSYVPQIEHIEDILPISVYEYIQFGLIGHQGSVKKIDEVLNLVGILKLKNYKLNQLSGGQKQRTLLAKAIIKNPEIIILDEPTKGLDSIGQDQLLKLLLHIKTTLKTTIILVDHNINQIMKYCDKMLCLNKTQHWHNKKELLSHGIIENIFNCEFEHRLIHENPSLHADHNCTEGHSLEKEEDEQ